MVTHFPYKLLCFESCFKKRSKNANFLVQGKSTVLTDNGLPRHHLERFMRKKILHIAVYWSGNGWRENGISVLFSGPARNTPQTTWRPDPILPQGGDTEVQERMDRRQLWHLWFKLRTCWTMWLLRSRLDWWGLWHLWWRMASSDLWSDLWWIRML